MVTTIFLLKIQGYGKNSQPVRFLITHKLYIDNDIQTHIQTLHRVAIFTNIAGLNKNHNIKHRPLTAALFAQITPLY